MPLQQPLSPEPGWTEVHSPELVQWDKPGETIAGVLLSVGEIAIKGKRVTQYTLQFGDKRFKFLGTFDLLQKLTRQHTGCKVRIKYLGEDENIRGGANNTPMKVFSVQIQGTPSNGANSGPITDDDIPF